MITDDLLCLIEANEGFEALPYRDTVGKLTVGFGHNLDSPMPKHLARLILKEDIKIAIRDLVKVLPDIDTYSTSRKNALTDMCFNLGLTKFKGFQKMIVAVKNDDWETAAKEAENSDWYNQVGIRGKKIVTLIREG